MAERYYTNKGEEYFPNATYQFTDQNGNIVESKGDNGYIWQAVTEGVPISINKNGEWYVSPYVENTSTGLVEHIPEWFTHTPEFEEWDTTYSPQLAAIGSAITSEQLNNINSILKQLGSNGGFRYMKRQLFADAGVTDVGIQDEGVNNAIQFISEGAGHGDAKLINIFGSDEAQSAAEIARDFKNMSKEDLSSIITKLTNIAQSAQKDSWTGSLEEQKNVADAITTLSLLNYVDDNYTEYGENEEFKGLLEASFWQKFQRNFATASATLTESSIFGLPIRLLYAATHNGSMDLESSVNEQLSTRADWGAGLEGLETSERLGMLGGAALNVAVTYITMSRIGNAVNGAFAGSSAANFVNTLNGTVGGRIASDFFLNDLPLDITMFINDIARNEGDVGKALYNTEETQPLTGLPFLRWSEGSAIPMLTGFGPEVPGGLVMNMVGDIIVDCAPAILGVVGRAGSSVLDGITNGGVTRLRENVAVKTIDIENKLAGNWFLENTWGKFVNHMIGPENAQYLREARKSAVAEGSTTPYIRAQNALTLVNHSGLTEIMPYYKELDSRLKITESVNDFIKNANKYGGFGETKVEWKVVERGTTKTFSQTVPDRIPSQVKQGLLDVERLSDLKGESLAEGGVLSNPTREVEIAEIEARLQNTPAEIKEFANRFSELNKGVEEIAVKLGIKPQEWVDALQLDPRWESYMTRQALVPGGQRSGGATDPTKAAILNKSRKGYYADNYIDPTLALSMKVEALGRAYAWNERSKLAAAFEVSNGNVIAGKGGIDAANKLAEYNKQIEAGNKYRDEIGWDSTIKKFTEDVSTYSSAFNRINTLLAGPEKLSLKSVYDSAQNPVIKEFVGEFNRGEIRFADDVVETSGISGYDASSIIKNTYSYNKQESIPANVEGSIRSLDYNAGVTDAGVPYRFEIEDGKITSFTKITDAEGIAESINHLGGIYRTTPEVVNKIGVENSYAINRGILFYRDSMPNLPIGPTYKAEFPSNPRKRNSIYGWIPGAGDLSEYNYRFVNGRIEADSSVYLGLGFYSKGRESKLAQSLKDDVRQGFHPKNSSAPENVPIHETGHNTMLRLALLEANRKIEAGTLKVSAETSPQMLAQVVKQEWNTIHERLAKNALDSMGIKYNGNNWKKKWREQADLISHYASTTKDGAYKWESFAEAMVDYWANKGNSQRFSLALVEQVQKVSEGYSMAAKPGEILVKNNLDVPKKLLKGDDYNFPAGYTNKQKAKWLDEYRQKNPYLNKSFDDATYEKANLWDTFFQKEIRAYDPSSKTSMPDSLAKKNGDFLEDLANNSAKKMVEEVRKAGGDFSEDLATMILSRNPSDIADAMDGFMVKKVNESAETIAKKMGELNEENLNRARATLWNDDTVKGELVRMMTELTPDSDVADIRSRVFNLCEEQAKGFASYDLLPVEMKDLVRKRNDAYARLQEENKKAIAYGKKVDKERTGYVGDVTQVISYKQNGEDVYYVVKDPVIASILKRPNNYKETGMTAEAIAQISNTWARLYRIGTTGANPVALVRNVLRDPVQATIQGGFNVFDANLSPEMFYKTLRQYGLDDTTIKTVTEKLHNWAASSSMTQEMRNMGIDSVGARGYRNNIEKASKAVNKLVDNKIIETLEAPLESWEAMFRNQIAQQSFTKNYRRTKDVDKALASAMFDASNSTTNFSHSIGIFNRATATVPYLSSAINGTRSFWVMFNVDPVGMIGRITAGFMVPIMGITAWNLSNDERREQYMKLPEWYRQTHIVLVDPNGNILATPIPEEIEQFAGTARKLIEYTNEVSPYSLPQILSQGALGFLPTDMDGFYGEDGSIEWGRGLAQMGSGLMPQAVTAIYEFIAEKDLFTGQDLSTYNGLNRALNLVSNTFGTGWKNVVNSIGMMVCASEDQWVGLSFANNLARDLFGVSFNDAKNQFMRIVGSQGGYNTETDKTTQATGLFKENEELQKKLESINREMSWADDKRKAELEEEKETLINNFTEKVSSLMNKYMQMYTITGGLEEWQKERLVKVLTLGGASSTGAEGSYQSADASTAYLNERALAQQRYVNAGLPAGPSMEALADNGSIELQAAINRFYGVTKQATQDYKNAIAESGLKDIRNEFYDAISKIYDTAEANGEKPDYDLIEKIQARYLQAVDAVLVPIINQYGISILNNNDFIDAVRRQVNGMIPSDDWRQSTKNAKRFLSTKEYPTATVDVKKWLKNRYASGMKDRNLSSDQQVTDTLDSIKSDIDAGRYSAAKGKIESLMSGIQKANYYISSKDLQTLSEYKKMVK